MEIIRISRQEQVEAATDYVWGKWGSETNRETYRDCIAHSLESDTLPLFYLVIEDGKTIGCFALLANDLISRQDLWPWVACVYVEPECRKRGIGGKMLNLAVQEAKRLGFDKAYLCTDHTGYYERYGWRYLCKGWSISGEETRIYEIDT